MSLDRDDRRRLKRLHHLLDEVERGGADRSGAPLEELPRLYRHASSVLARLEARAAPRRERDGVRALVVRAHTLLYPEPPAHPGGPLARLVRLYLVESPRAVRAEWRLLLPAFAVFYGLAALAYAGVRADLDLAFSLLDPAAVTAEIAQLEALGPGESFRGNFTFGLGESPGTAGWILIHNIGVGIVFFASALVPPLFLLILVSNALMLGTYTAVAGHWDQAGAISSVLWCHGTVELQTIVLAGVAGLTLVRAIALPGPWSRRHSLQLASRRAWHLLAPVFPMLVAAGLIEGYLSPHAPAGVRMAIAVSSGALMLAWALGAGRGRAPSGADAVS